MYDNQNVFAKILRGEIPLNDKVYENEYALSFYNINPISEKHVLIIPKGEYENILDFSKNASSEEQAGFWDCFVQTTKTLGVNADFNIFANAGENAPFFKQSVFHFHLHLVAGNRNAEFEKIIDQI